MKEPLNELSERVGTESQPTKKRTPRRILRPVIRTAFVWLAAAASCGAPLGAAEPRQWSGIYPHLATFNNEGECGTGAVVPWADRLWVVSYAPHAPRGSSDKLYEITPDLRQIIRPESRGGTPANRMIHRESNQLFIGPYAIDAQGHVRVIPYEQMPGRPTGNARHLTDPASKIYFATMEEGFYEVDVKTLAVRELYPDANRNRDISGDLLPGYHGKGFFTAQGRVVYANNGEVSAAAQESSGNRVRMPCRMGRRRTGAWCGGTSSRRSAVPAEFLATRIPPRILCGVSVGIIAR